jgi:hypothetical protein
LFVDGVADNVGIGESSPTHKLHITGPASSDNQTYSQLMIESEGTYPGSMAGISLNSTSSHQSHLRFLNNGSLKFQIRYNSANIADDKLKIFSMTQNSDIVTFDGATGRVGIGTTSPQRQLEIYSGSNAQMALTSTNTTAYREIIFYEGTTGLGDIFQNGSTQTNYAGAYSLNIANLQNAPIGFYTNGTANERMRIAADGNVGIGTTSPSEKLHVAGDVLIDGDGGTIAGTTWDNGLLKIGSSSGGISIDTNEIYASHDLYLGSLNSASAIILRHSTTERMRVASNGYVGIGTSSPQDKLHVNGGRIRIENVTDPKLSFNDGSANRSEIFYDTSEETFVLNHTDADANQLVLTSGNDVGIGTNAPNATLHVYSAASGDNIFNVEGTNGSLFGVTDNLSGVLMSVNTIAGLPVLEVNSDYSVTAGRFNQNDFVISSSGNVGIGTGSPANKLDVVGSDNTTIASFSDGTDGVQIATRGTGRQQIDFIGSNIASINAKSSLYLNYDSDNNGSNDGIIFARNNNDESGTIDAIITEGKVGIGTASPSEKLHVYGTAAGDGALIGNAKMGVWENDANFASFTHNDIHSTSNSYALLQKNDGNTYLNAASSRKLHLRINNDNAIIVDTDKSVKMLGDSTNTTWTGASPTLAIKRASSSPYISFHSDTGTRLGYLQFQSSSASRLNVETYNDLIISTNSLERMTVSKDGYVNFSNYLRIDYTNDERGIVFEDAGGDDTIYMTVNDGQGNFNIMLGVNHDGNNIITGDGAAKFMLGGHSTDGFASMNAGLTGTAATSAIYNIGLGVFSTDQTLRIGNPNDSSGLHRYTIPNSGVPIADVDGDLITRYLRARDANGIQIGDDSDTLGIFVKDGGNVGIGTGSPATKFHVDNGTNDGEIFRLSNEEIGLIADITGDTTRTVTLNATRLDGGSYPTLKLAGQGKIEFAVNANNVRAVIDSNGNLGIGTTGPLYKLDVNGDARVDNLYTDGNISAYGRLDGGLLNEPAPGLPLLSQAMDTSVTYTDIGKNVPSTTIRGIVWTGKHYLILDHNNDTLYFYDSDFNAIEDAYGRSSIVLPGSLASPHGLAWDGRYLWCLDYSNPPIRIHGFDINRATPVRIATATLSGDHTYGLGYAEGLFYYVSDATIYAYRWDGGNNFTQIFSATPGFTAGFDPQAITYDGSYLWIGKNGASIYKCNLDGDIIATISSGVPPNICGWTWNGENIVTFNYSTQDIYVINTSRRLIFSEAVGIGTTSPSQKLQVNGNFRLTGAFYDSNNAAGTSGQVLSSTATGTDWISLSEIQGVDGTGSAGQVAFWSDADTITGESNLYWDSANNRLGINTSSPSSPYSLHVNGYALIQAGTQPTLKIDAINTSSPSYTANIELNGYGGRGQGIFFKDKDYANEEWFMGMPYQGYFDKFQIGYDSSGGQGEYLANAFVTVNYDGNVGIGTTSPLTPLHVKDAAGSDGIRTEYSTDSDYNLRLDGAGRIRHFRGNGSTGVMNLITDLTSGAWGGNAGGSIVFSPRNTEAARFDGLGNFGIGTTSPSAKLDVKGTWVSNQGLLSLDADNGTRWAGLTMQNNGTAYGYLYHDNTDSYVELRAATSNGIRFFTDNAYRMFITSLGDVGIGTASPAEKLHVSDLTDFIVNVDDTATRIGTQGNYDLAFVTNRSTATDSTRFIIKAANAGEALRIDANNNVGVGTDSPNAVLHAYGSTPSGTVFNVEGTNGSLFSVVDNLSGVLMSVNNNAGLPVFEVNDDDSIVAGRFAQNDFVVTTSGDIGMGTANPSSKLEVNGTVTATCASLGQLNVDSTTYV